MTSKASNETLGKLLYLGAPLVTVFLVTGLVTDPVNIPKLLALSTLSVSMLFVLIFRFGSNIMKENKSFLILISIFVVAGLNSVLNSTAPIEQTFYGTYGRSTGLLTYLMLSIVALAASQVRVEVYFRKIIVGLLVAGAINVIYCAWVLIFGDFIGWNNLYGEILGLFGNPDFISAFLGTVIVATFALILQPGLVAKYRILGTILIFIASFEVVKSKAIQGIVVTAGGAAIVGFFYIRARFSKTWVTATYTSILALVSTLSVLGTLQQGPLKFIYKKSVSLRGSYWHAGFDMGRNHLFSGIGMDSYGDWYRRTRPPAALIDMPGVGTVSNVSHNVFIDLFAFGGLPLIISYLGIILLVIFSIFRVVRRVREYDSIFISLMTAWICYQVQSIISINQIGLAIWGWLLSGLLIAYEIATRPVNIGVETITAAKKSKARTSTEAFISPTLLAGIGALVGLLISAPPFGADSRYFSALKSRNANQVELALQPSYLNPSSSYRYDQAINLFSSSNLPDQALKYARIAVKFNPDDYTAWLQLYWLKNVTASEKSDALMNLKRLDPKNPDVTNPNPQ
jgi:hypothetical protein